MEDSNILTTSIKTRTHSNLSISLFDMNRIKNNANILIIGMRASGKSTLIRDILYHKQSSHIGGVFSKTERLNKYYGDFCPAETIYHEFNKYVVIDTINKQKDSNKTNNIINVMDDCFSSKTDWTVKPEITNMMDRSNNMMNIFSIQFPLSFTDNFIDSFDYIFFMHEGFTSNIHRLHKYVKFINKMDDFNRIFTHITRIHPFNSLVVDNTNNSSEIEDRLYWYKAENDLPDFRIKNYTDTITISNYFKPDEDNTELFLSDSSENTGESFHYNNDSISIESSEFMNEFTNSQELNIPSFSSPLLEQLNKNKSSTMESSTVQSSTVESDMMQSNMMQSNMIQSSTVESDMMQSDMMQSSTVQSNMVQSNMVQSNMVQSNMVQSNMMTITVNNDVVTINKNNIVINIKL
jgi:hypothetical protein